MNLRTKLLIPLFTFCIVLVLFAHFLWLPKFLHFVEEEDREHLESHLTSISEGLVPLLLENQLANVFDNLATLMEKNPSWRSVKLFDSHGKLLFPLNEPEKKQGSGKLQEFWQPISYLDHSLGMLYVGVNIDADIKAVQKIQRDFTLVMLVLVILLVLGIALIFELIIRKPVQELSNASRLLAKGDFDAPLSKKRSDEIGRLVGNFADMRNSLQRFQNELVKEIGSHKHTAQELYKEKERFSFHATHDSLTGLINRYEFENRVQLIIEDTRRESSEHAILYMDLDQFKVVNDTCGHFAGDELLRQLGPMLHKTVREGDTIARLGGDEFGVLLDHCPKQKTLDIAQSIQEMVQDFRFAWQDNIFSVGVSIGVVIIDEHSNDFQTVLSYADAACYAAKDQGRNRIHVYEYDDALLAQRYGEMRWVSQINKALEEDRFTLYCQPIVPIGIKNHDVFHFEVLIRIVGDNGEITPPGAFIPAAERYNLMTMIDRWVIKSTFSFLSQLLADDPSKENKLFCSINLSGSSLSDDTLLDFIKSQFEETGIPNKIICFEITETSAIANLTKASNLIRQLRTSGCYFSLDDFGSGLSSFGYLKNLPVDFLKIDGVFVKDIAKDPIDYAMVNSINEIGHVMGMKTIAEFAENDKIIELLRRINVDYAQGYGIAPPFPLAEIAEELPVSSAFV